MTALVVLCAWIAVGLLGGMFFGAFVRVGSGERDREDG